MPKSHGAPSEEIMDVIEGIENTSYPVLIRGPAGT